MHALVQSSSAPVDLVETLLNAGADLSIKNEKGYTPFMCAVMHWIHILSRRGHARPGEAKNVEQITKLLLEQEATNINEQVKTEHPDSSHALSLSEHAWSNSAAHCGD